MGIRFRHSIALVQNISKSKEFYQNIMGLEIINEFDTFILFKENFAIHQAELFYQYINKPYHEEKMGHDNVDFYFTTSDLSKLTESLKKAQVRFIHDIRLCEWGESVIRIYDPDGHILEIGDAE